MTVVLFASIFAWITTFPTPAPQNVTQFSANLVPTANGSYVQKLQITHLAGPAVSGSALIYLKSAYYPRAPAFIAPNDPIVASSYLPNPTVWNLGQTFSYTFPAGQLPQLPDNITILILSNDQLIYSTILPGTPIAVPPTFVAAGISPANPTVGGSFTVMAVVTGATGGANVYVTLSNLPGLSSIYPTAQIMTYTASTNRWTFTVPAGDTTANGTYYAFVNVTNPQGQSATAGVAVSIVSTSGSSSTSPTLSVAVVMTPEPPTLPATSSYFAAVVTYLGTLTGTLTVGFWANQTPGSPPGMPTPWKQESTTLTGATTTITGPSTVTVYSNSPATFSAWLLNSSVRVTARGSVSGVGTASGSTSFATANLVTGIVQPNPATTFSDTCTTTCPFLNDTVWNNWTNTVTFSGIITVNVSGVEKTSYTVSGSVTAGSKTTVSGPGATTRWKPTWNGATLLSTWLTVSYSGVPIGYIYDTFTITT